jgi:hypothetical protein
LTESMSMSLLAELSLSLPRPGPSGSLGTVDWREKQRVAYVPLVATPGNQCIGTS